MNVKRFLSNSYCRNIDKKITNLVVNHQASQTHRGGIQTATKAMRSLNPTFAEPNIDMSSDLPSKMYLQKCQDMKIRANSAAEKRFVEKFISSVQKKSIRFSGFGLGPSCIPILFELLSLNPQFLVLDLSLNKFGDSGAELFSKFIKNDSPCVSIDLRSNAIGISGSIALFQALRVNHHITSLDLSAIDGIERNRIGTGGCAALARALQENQILSSLNISMTGITSDGCTYIGPALAKNESLTYLNLSSNRFGTSGAKALFSQDGVFSYLEYVILSHNGITDAASQMLCKQIQFAKNLKVLDLSGNHLGHQFLSYLSDAFFAGGRLETLNLGENKIGSDCGEDLAIIVKDFPFLKHLSLKGNPLKDSGASILATSLLTNFSIQTLDLSDTMISDETGTIFAQVIEKHPGLQQLSLAKNSLTDKSGPLIAQALGKAKNLSLLNLSDNEFREATAKALMEHFHKGGGLADIDTSYNDFDYRSYLELSKMLTEHRKNLNEGTAELAKKHIQWLKIEERKLKRTRADIEDQEENVQEGEIVQNQKQQLLQDTKLKNQEDIKKATDELTSIKEECDRVREQRKNVTAEFNKTKRELEIKQAEALSDLQTLVGRRQMMETKVSFAELRKAQCIKDHSEKLDELKLKEDSLKEEIKRALLVLKDAQMQLLAPEEETVEEKVPPKSKTKSHKKKKKTSKK